MTQFRPAPAIEADRVLAESFRNGDDAAIRSMVTRFGSQVTGLLTAHGTAGAAAEVFVEAWVLSDDFEAGADFGPWLRSIAVDSMVGDTVLSEADESRWHFADAVASLDAADVEPLRRFHVDRGELSPDAERSELRLRRRVSHLGTDDEIDAALADPLVWARVDDGLADLVVARIAAASESAAEAPAEKSAQSSLGRSVRPVLFGIGGAMLVLFAAILVLSAAGGEVDEPAFTIEVTPTGRIVGVEAGELSVVERDSGVELDLDAFTLPRRSGDQLYAAVLVLDDGREVVAGSFNEGFGVRLTVGVDLERIDRMYVSAADLADVVREDAAVLKADFPRSNG